MTTQHDDAAILLHYDAARAAFARGIGSQAIPDGIRRVYCIGYPTFDVPESLRQSASKVLGVPVDEFPDALAGQTAEQIYRVVTERYRQFEQALSLTADDCDYARMKANDAVGYRAGPLAELEWLLEQAITNGLARTVVVPWYGERFATVERPGFLGLDAPGHQLAAILRRLKTNHHVRVHSLWPYGLRKDRRSLRCSRGLMAAARGVTLTARAVRDQLRPFPNGRPEATNDGRPRLGFVVGASSCWYHLKALYEAAGEQFDRVLISQDVIRNPSAWKVLNAAGEPFVSVNSQVGPLGTAWSLARKSLSETLKLRRLRSQAAGSSIDVQEATEQIAADLACRPELELYVRQLQRAIRRYALDAVVSANVRDAYLDATTDACRRDGIRHFCVQNHPLRKLALPRYADCDVFFAESRECARFLTQHGAAAAVESMGLPFYDELIRARNRNADQPISDSFPHLRGRKIVQVITQAAIDFTPLLDALIKCVESHPEIGVIIRLHPRSPPNTYAAYGAKLERLGAGGCMQHGDLVATLCETDCILTMFSSVTLWSIIMGVPPFCWVPPRSVCALTVDGMDYFRPEVATTDADPDRIVARMIEFSADSRQQRDWQQRRDRFLNQYCTGADGMACTRILNHIQDALVDSETSRSHPPHTEAA